MLNLTQEHTPKFQPDDPRLSELDDARDKCHDALRELVQLKDHFDDVGPQSQVTWERLGWGVEELVEIRTKLSIYIQALNVINCSISRFDLHLRIQLRRAQMYTDSVLGRPWKTLNEC